MFIRNNTYYFRRRVPKALSEFYSSSTHIVKSLHTKDRVQASLQYSTLSLELDKIIFLYSNSFIDNKMTLEALTELKLLSKKDTKKKLLVSEVIEVFIKDSMIKSKWTDKTLKEFRRILAQFLEILTDRAIEDVTRENLWKYRDVLFLLPMNYNQKKEYMKKTISQILKMDIPDEHKPSIVTVDKKLSKVSSFFRFAYENRYILENPSVNLTVNGKAHKQPYKAYSTEDIERLFSSPLYTYDEKTRCKRPEWYWIPLIALYSGMRQTEIAQLYKADVREEQGVWVFDINKNTPDKKVKNKSSIRLVPIHKELIRLGLLDYVSSVKSEDRLWMNLSYGKDGYATTFTKHFYSKYNRKHISEEKKKVFHSYRKTFVTKLEQLTLLGEINHNAVKALVGHSFSNDITLEVYTQGFDIGILKEVIDKFDWK